MELNIDLLKSQGMQQVRSELCIMTSGHKTNLRRLACSVSYLTGYVPLQRSNSILAPFIIEK